jgi:DNA polymerase III delta subunit
MLYLVYGTNRDAAIAKKDELVRSCHAKRPDAEVFVLNTENFSVHEFQALYSSQGLFEKKHIVILDGLFGEIEIADVVLSGLPFMAKTESVFIIFEELFDARTKNEETIKKHAEKFFGFGVKREEKQRDNTSFLITDAFGAKDRKSAWVNFQKAIRAGVSPEEIHGALSWQVRSILLAKKTKSAQESGLNSFTHGKSASFAKNFTEEELDEILERLTDMYHGIRSDGGELEIELEKFLLNG